MANENLDPIYLKLYYNKELCTYGRYTIEWNFEVDKEGRNILSSSPEISCKTGFFHGPGKYFEFSFHMSGRILTVFAKMMYPNTNNTDSVEKYEMIKVSIFPFSKIKSDALIRSHDMSHSRSLSSNPKSSDQASLHEQWMTTSYILDVNLGGMKFQIDMKCETGSRDPPHSNSETTYVTAQQNPPVLSSYLYSEDNSDVKLYCQNKEYWAHKLLLCNKSSVFQAMFSHPMVENKAGKVNIEDTEPKILKEFLRYIYNGSVKVKDIEKHALGIILIADKYDIQDLKLLSELVILSEISNENVMECYSIGKLVNSESIVKKCINRIQENKRILWKTADEFLEAHNKFPQVFYEVFMSGLI